MSKQRKQVEMPEEVPACDWCPARTPADQFKAHLHWLRDFTSHEDLKAHLQSTLTTTPGVHEAKAGRIDSILQWWRGIQQDFDRDIDEYGQRCRAWEAWAMQQATPACRSIQDLQKRLHAAGLAPGGTMYA